MNKPNELVIHEADEDNVEYWIGQNRIIGLNYDEDGSESFINVRYALTNMARACGMTVRVVEGSEEGDEE